MKNSSIITVLSLSVAALAGSASADLITNGDFETGDFTGWRLIGDAWRGVVSGQNENNNVAWFAARTGAAMDQQFAANAGDTLHISFQLRVFNQSVQYGWGATQDNNVSVKFNSTLLTSVDNIGTGWFSESGHTFAFDVTADSWNVLAFNFRNNDSNGNGFMWLDNVSVTATPAPGAAALIGLAGLVGGRRRKA
jgi:MYXO-CTERM domain-containing protein